MADIQKRLPELTQCVARTGAVYLYVQASEDLDKDELVRINVNGRLSRRQPKVLPHGITTEAVKKNEYTFIQVQEGQPQQQQQPAMKPLEVARRG